jgi:hypothetical protein
VGSALGRGLKIRAVRGEGGFETRPYEARRALDRAAALAEGQTARGFFVIAATTRAEAGLRVGAGVDEGGQEDVAEAVETERVEIVVGKVELEPAAEILDSSFELFPAEGGDGDHQLFELPMWLHGCDLRKRFVILIRLPNIQAVAEVSDMRPACLGEKSPSAGHRPKLAYYWPENFLWRKWKSDNVRS